MPRFLAPALALALAAQAAGADEFTEVIEEALDAYRAGDITVAQEELEYALGLLRELKAASLADYLPAPLDGWTRQDEDAQGAGFGMAVLGGGSSAAATYRRGSESLTITLVANSPVVSGIGAMITGMGAIAGGRPLRIQRVQFANNEGELQGVVEGRVLVMVSGNASVDDKVAHLEAMDLRALAGF